MRPLRKTDRRKPPVRSTRGQINEIYDSRRADELVTIAAVLPRRPARRASRTVEQPGRRNAVAYGQRGHGLKYTQGAVLRPCLPVGLESGGTRRACPALAGCASPLAPSISTVPRSATKRSPANRRNPDGSFAFRLYVFRVRSAVVTRCRKFIISTPVARHRYRWRDVVGLLITASPVSILHNLNFVSRDRKL